MHSIRGEGVIACDRLLRPFISHSNGLCSAQLSLWALCLGLGLQSHLADSSRRVAMKLCNEELDPRGC